MLFSMSALLAAASWGRLSSSTDSGLSLRSLSASEYVPWIFISEFSGKMDIVYFPSAVKSNSAFVESDLSSGIAVQLPTMGDCFTASLDAKTLSFGLELAESVVEHPTRIRAKMGTSERSFFI